MSRVTRFTHFVPVPRPAPSTHRCWGWWRSSCWMELSVRRKWDWLCRCQAGLAIAPRWKCCPHCQWLWSAPTASWRRWRRSPPSRRHRRRWRRRKVEKNWDWWELQKGFPLAYLASTMKCVGWSGLTSGLSTHGPKTWTLFGSNGAFTYTRKGELGAATPP